MPRITWRDRLHRVVHSRVTLALAVLMSIVVPAITLPRLPEVSVWPVIFGLVPWVVGKYVLCPLRWRVLTNADLSRQWHLRAYAESELLGLLTPGHVGADAWRIYRLSRTGLRRGDSVMSVGMDRLVGAIGLAVFAVLGGTMLPLPVLLGALGFAVVLIGVALVVRRLRPELMKLPSLPRPRQLAHGLLLSAGYQLTIAGLLLGTVAATGHSLSPLALLAAFGASQVAGAIPGPHGASARDGALVVALVSIGLPWTAAAAAVALKAALAWLPALILGGVSLALTRRALRHQGGVVQPA